MGKKSLWSWKGWDVPDAVLIARKKYIKKVKSTKSDQPTVGIPQSQSKKGVKHGTPKTVDGEDSEHDDKEEKKDVKQKDEMDMDED
jgi:hypothetical protein